MTFLIGLIDSFGSYSCLPTAADDDSALSARQAALPSQRLLPDTRRLEVRWGLHLRWCYEPKRVSVSSRSQSAFVLRAAVASPSQRH